MVKTFSISEHNLIRILLTQKTFMYGGREYSLIFAGKPVTKSGEPKTDIFLYAKSLDSKEEPFVRKISYKQPNYDFVENKISATRAEEIFGENWSSILINSLSKLKPIFLNRKIVFKDGFQRVQAGSFTLGWKIELLNKKSGDLSLKMPLSIEQVRGIYSGNNLRLSKRDALVDGRTIKDSGIADYILVGQDYESIENLLDNLVDIKTYVNKNPDVYLACKALNYRSFEKKYDGNRPLGVYIEWEIKNNKLTGKPILTQPLEKGGDEVFEKLSECMDQLGIKTTDDIGVDNTESSIIFQK